jgi:hypothetical protein
MFHETLASGVGDISGAANSRFFVLAALPAAHRGRFHE